jgi:hypothetical protein
MAALGSTASSAKRVRNRSRVHEPTELLYDVMLSIARRTCYALLFQGIEKLFEESNAFGIVVTAETHEKGRWQEGIAN